eukprot:gnl/Chilomastix_cuspidata/559.p1 GENE.gnl/Chilomastix_cuspidata/559~~gnl/Chilomastix_cuspidata/559.p1  ORF type:complete len:1134 (-),score=518.54 gnl/Chilomastix_cuspidata/559:1006-4407(-)
MSSARIPTIVSLPRDERWFMTSVISHGFFSIMMKSPAFRWLAFFIVTSGPSGSTACVRLGAINLNLRAAPAVVAPCRHVSYGRARNRHAIYSRRRFGFWLDWTGPSMPHLLGLLIILALVQPLLAHAPAAAGLGAETTFVFDSTYLVGLEVLPETDDEAQQFSYAVSAVDSTVFLSAPASSACGASACGEVYSYTASDNALDPVGAVTAAGQEGEQFGFALGANASTLVAGAPGSGAAGAALTYLSPFTDVLLELAPSDASVTNFGKAVDASGALVIVGGDYDADGTNVGYAEIFDVSGDSASSVFAFTGAAGTDVNCGASVAISDAEAIGGFGCTGGYYALYNNKGWDEERFDTDADRDVPVAIAGEALAVAASALEDDSVISFMTYSTGLFSKGWKNETDPLVPPSGATGFGTSFSYDDATSTLFATSSSCSNMPKGYSSCFFVFEGTPDAGFSQLLLTYSTSADIPPSVNARTPVPVLNNPFAANGGAALALFEDVFHIYFTYDHAIAPSDATFNLTIQFVDDSAAALMSTSSLSVVWQDQSTTAIQNTTSSTYQLSLANPGVDGDYPISIGYQFAATDAFTQFRLGQQEIDLTLNVGFAFSSIGGMPESFSATAGADTELTLQLLDADGAVVLAEFPIAYQWDYGVYTEAAPDFDGETGDITLTIPTPTEVGTYNLYVFADTIISTQAVVEVVPGASAVCLWDPRLIDLGAGAVSYTLTLLDEFSNVITDDRLVAVEIGGTTLDLPAQGTDGVYAGTLADEPVLGTYDISVTVSDRAETFDDLLEVSYGVIAAQEGIAGTAVAGSTLDLEVSFFNAHGVRIEDGRDIAFGWGAAASSERASYNLGVYTATVSVPEQAGSRTLNVYDDVSIPISKAVVVSAGATVGVSVTPTSVSVGKAAVQFEAFLFDAFDNVVLEDRLDAVAFAGASASGLAVDATGVYQFELDAPETGASATMSFSVSDVSGAALSASIALGYGTMNAALGLPAECTTKEKLAVEFTLANTEGYEIQDGRAVKVGWGHDSDAVVEVTGAGGVYTADLVGPTKSGENFLLIADRLGARISVPVDVSMSGGTIAGIVIGIIVGVAVVVAIILLVVLREKLPCGRAAADGAPLFDDAPTSSMDSVRGRRE